MASETESRNLAELFGDPGESKSAAELEETIARLELIASADYMNLYEPKLKDGKLVLLDPKNWPEAERAALVDITPNAQGVRFRMVDKTQAINMLARLKGQFRNEDEQANPLETAFARLPRSDLLKLAEVVGHLVKSSEVQA